MPFLIRDRLADGERSGCEVRDLLHGRIVAYEVLEDNATSVMVVFSFYIFDRHGKSGFLSCPAKSVVDTAPADCIYKRKWLPKDNQANGLPDGPPRGKALSAEDDAKLVFGTIFSLRNMVKKLGGPEDKYVSVSRTLREA